MSSEKKRARERELEMLEAFARDYKKKNEGTVFNWKKFWREFRQNCYPELSASRNSSKYHRIYERVRHLCDPKYRMEKLTRSRRWRHIHREAMREYGKQYYSKHREDYVKHWKKGEETLKKALDGKCEICGKQASPELLESHEESKVKEHFPGGRKKPMKRTTWYRRWMIAYLEMMNGKISEEELKKHIPMGIHLVHPLKCHWEAEKRFP